MRSFIFILVSLLFTSSVYAQTDTGKLFPYNFIEPGEYVIKDIKVRGASYVQKELVVLLTDLSINQKIRIPGDEIPRAIDNLWKEQYFSNITVELTPLEGNNIQLTFAVQERPRLSKFTFRGLKNSERKSLRDEVSLKGGMIMTSNLINRTRREIVKHYREKGYWNAKVEFYQKPDSAKKNHNILYIIVDKGPKVKVEDFEFYGNDNVSDAKLRKSFKKIKRKHLKINIFASSKFNRQLYDEEKTGIVTIYNSMGYRDASLVRDSVVQTGSKRVKVKIWVNEGRKYYFRNIAWRGNVRYRTGTLDTILGIRKGDVYNQALLDERLFANAGGYDISTLYMDNGYLFFNVTPVETGVFNDSIDLEVRIYEGEQATINRINITGNTKTSDHVILRELRTRPGDKFSRGDIQRSVRDLVNLGYFDPQQMNVNPVPNPVDGTVDIDYQVTEKPSDQIELSGGYGGNGFTGRPAFVGTLGLTLNNFSSRKFFKPGTWNPIPTGDGQRLSVRAQSSGQGYQGYNFSFTEPWMGGRKPNSFSVSLFHSVFGYDWKQKKDPTRSVLFNTGGSVSLGKRLKWPDDFFSFNSIASFQRYRFQNSGQNFGIPNYPRTGIVYNPSVQLILTRNSIFNPIFPEGGSNVTFSVQATPPLSLLSKKDYSSLPIGERLRWAEYHKWRFDASWFTPLNRGKSLILATIAKFGYLGNYNKAIGTSYFERFRMGGTGMIFGGLIGAEIVPMRGYDEFAPADISSVRSGSSEFGTFFNKYTMELRYAVSKNPQATVYLLGFLEGGNSWLNYRNYNPFVLRRSGGVGIRLFLPMFGLVGLDWGRAFDWKTAADGSKSKLQFLIGQQF